MENLIYAENIWNRLQAGNHSIIFYYHYSAELKSILSELRGLND